MSRRAVLLAGLAITVFASQAIWITFSPVGSLVARELGVSKERIGLLAITYPVFFLLLTIPSGLLLDRSFKRWLSLGVYLTVLGGVLRLASPGNYYWLLFCQLLGALGQPFLLNSFAPFASRVYPEKREMAVSLLSFSMYLGIIYGLGSGYWLYTRYGLYMLLAPLALVSLLGGVLFAYGAWGYRFPGVTAGESVRGELKRVAGYRELWLLGIVLGLGVALFDNMSIWLESALATVDLGDIAGLSVALSLLLGLVGVAFIPTPVARRGKRTLYIRGVTLAGILVYYGLALYTARYTVLTLIPLLGLLMLPAYPIIMEWISTFYPRKVHGSASGFIGFVSRIFTVILASVAVFFIESPRSYFSFLGTLAIVAFIVALLLPGDK
ncbi:MAG: MFS transporter [Desulfurococcales archaeon]|nr:MFS transporter [Desulfurococcales archaeon]